MFVLLNDLTIMLEILNSENKDFKSTLQSCYTLAEYILYEHVVLL